MRATAVIVTWNGAHRLAACLDSLRAQTRPVDVLVVDNASPDGTAALLAARQDVRVLTAERNLGFAGGCALALAQVDTPYALLLNDDAVAAPEWARALVEAAELDPGLGAVTAKVLLADRFLADERGPYVLADGTRARAGAVGFDVLNSTGNEVRTDGLGQDRDWLQRDEAPAPAEVFGFSGAAALLRMAAVEQAGSFDARYFLYYEDTDLSWRMRLLGWRVAYEPAAVVRHEHSASTVEGSDLHRFHDLRNRLLTLVKCAPAPLLAAALLRVLLTTASGVRRERPPWRLTRLRLRALGSFVRLLPHAVRVRRALADRATRAAVAAELVPAATGRAFRTG